MNFDLTDDQNILISSVARMLEAESSPGRVRAAEQTGFDAALWRSSRDFGLVTFRTPEGGGSLIDALLIAEQAGRVLVSVPMAETMVTARLLATLKGEAARRWYEQVLAGELVTFVPDAAAGLSGNAHGATAAQGIVALDKGRLVIAHGAGVSDGQSLGDAAMGRARADAHIEILAEGGEAAPAFERALEEWKLLTAAMVNGLARRSLELASAYANERHAFGRAIGSYQGIAHPLADAVIEVEGGQLLLRKAVWAIAQGQDNAAALISMAYAWSAQSAARAVARALHSFGGYGVSLEYDIQLYYRRAKAWPLVAGDPQRELLTAARRLWSGAEAALPDAGEIALDFAYPQEAIDYSARVRQFFDDNLTPELRAAAHHSVSGYDADFHRKLAEAGLLFPHWPREIGGVGSGYAHAVVVETLSELGWEHVTGPITGSVGYITSLFATNDVLRRAVAEMARGEALGCLGFSEPGSGSDLFAAKTKAERTPDGWSIDGSKMFTTAGNLAKYCFLLARTAPDKPRHLGMTVFLVPLDAPGVEIQAVQTLQDERTNIIYFSDVIISDDHRIGGVDNAMGVMAAMLEIEHGSANQYRVGHAAMLKAATRWAQTARRDGAPLLNDSDAAIRLARAVMHGEISKMLCHRAIWMMAEGRHSRYWGPMAKVFATEFYNRDAIDLMDLAAPQSLFAGHEGLGQVEIGYRQSIGTTIYGGTSEIQRSLVAEQALGLPKSRS